MLRAGLMALPGLTGRDDDVFEPKLLPDRIFFTAQLLAALGFGFGAESARGQLWGERVV
jgi:hypothetical protein